MLATIEFLAGLDRFVRHAPVTRDKGKRIRCCVLLALAVAAAACPMAAAAQSPPRGPRKVALLVGATAAAPGRKPLLYSHQDAARMHSVLTTVGGFSPEDIVTLKDPDPKDLLGAIDKVSSGLKGARESLLYFYYSGHADAGTIYPSGRALALSEVRAALERSPASVKVGMMDACRGGSWTRTKGLVATEPFDITAPVNLGSEGSVLIAASSGMESAHESDRLQGSFFTHHFAGALLGAGDRNADGEVTLNEAFEYAREHTIRDTLRASVEVQSPSYAVNLRGRHDLVLAEVAGGPSTLYVTQRTGPLELLQATSGLQVLELAPGPRHVRLALPAGRYVLRLRTERGNFVQEFTIAPKTVRSFAEQDLTLVGLDVLAAKKHVAATPAVAAAADRSEPVGRAAWVKPTAIGLAVATVVSGALAYKFSRDIRAYNRQLDPYRRFPCANDNAARACDQDGNMVGPLVADDMDEVSRIHARGETAYDLMSAAAIASVALLIAGAPVYFKLFTTPAARPSSDVRVTVAPLIGPTVAGLNGALAF